MQKQKNSATGNWTRVSRVTGGDTHHYTIADLFGLLLTYVTYKRVNKTQQKQSLLNNSRALYNS